MKPPLDVRQMRSAARRFEERQVNVATEKFKARIVDPPREPRKEWLASNLSHERARATVNEAEAHGAGSSADRTLSSLGRERIIGSNDMRDINYLELAIAVARAVCRIRIGSSAASGFLIGPRLLMTNNHVLRSSEDARRAEAQFDYQENAAGDLLVVQTFRLDPEALFLTDPVLDFTVVGVAAVSSRGASISRYPWLKLIGTLGKAEKGDPLNIIQHPVGGLKQIALRNNEIIEIPLGKPDFLYYSTDTEPGSSGSPCFNDQWELVALHHSGVPKTHGAQFLKRDGTPWREGVDDPALLDWIANEGARVSALVNALREAPLTGSASDLRNQTIDDTPPNPIELARTASVGGSGVADRFGGGDARLLRPGGASVTISVPLNITFSLGEPGTGAVPHNVTLSDVTKVRDADPTLVDVVATEALKIDPDWGTRTGYDPDFLGEAIPLPTLSAAQKKDTVEVPAEYRVDDNKYVLHYHHYSLAMNSKRRFAWYSAAIIDGDRRTLKLPKRQGDKWSIDPRIDDPKAPVFQCGEDLYATTKTDRGHLTRYLDVAWGDRLPEALNSMADTFFFTNCCLQLSDFNQGKDRWQGIEQFLLEKKSRKEKRRIVVITGPIFKDNDPVYRNPRMKYSVRVPIDFWKVCAIIREDNSLAATGFVLSQEDITELPGFEELFDVTEVQVTIKEIEQRTGLKFPVLRANDHFAAGGDPGTLEIAGPGGGKRRVKPIRSYEDIVV